MKKTIYGLTILCSVLLLVSGCGKIPVLENGEESLMTLGGKEIAVSTFYETLKEKYGVEAVVDMIDTTILEEEYKTDDDETDYIDEQYEYVVSYAKQNDTSVTELLKYYYGVSTEAEFKKLISLDYKRNLAIKDYVKTLITEKEINNYYKDSIKGDMNAKHILISPETADGMTDAEVATAKKEALTLAKSIIKKLKAGEDFATLAKEYSDDDSTKDKGGDLGWFNTGDMEEAFEKAAYALKKGAYTTTPVETSYGYHIIYKIDEKDKPTLEEVKDDIIDTLVEKKLTEDSSLQYKALENLRKEYGLEIHDDELNKEYKSYLKSLY